MPEATTQTAALIAAAEEMLAEIEHYRVKGTYVSPSRRAELNRWEAAIAEVRGEKLGGCDICGQAVPMDDLGRVDSPAGCETWACGKCRGEER